MWGICKHDSTILSTEEAFMLTQVCDEAEMNHNFREVDLNDIPDILDID